MQLHNNTILLTGGATGIGLALAERLHRAGSTVIICGRRAAKLREAQQRLPGLHTYACDLAQAADRAELARRVLADFPALNVLLNNAGVQHRVRLAQADTSAAGWAAQQQEIAINLEAPVHLSLLLLPHLQRQPGATIINVTSGLAFAPGAFAPVYSATKAALHSFTLTLRHQVAATGVQVLEIAPPAVDTDLGGSGLHFMGAPVAEFAESVLARLAAGELEVGYGPSEALRLAGRTETDATFRQMNGAG